MVFIVLNKLGNMFCRTVVLLCVCITYINGESLSDKDELKRFVREGLDLVTQNVLAEQGNRMWHAYTFDSGISNREELVVRSIASNNEFNIGQQVTEWQSINVRNKSYAVGLMSTGFTVLTAVLNREKSGFTTTARLITFEEYPSAFTIFKIWNSAERRYDIILIAALVGQKFDMHWYRIREDNNLEEIWWWHLHKRVCHLKVFETGGYSKLLIINEAKNVSDVTTANIYNFILDKNVSDFWLFQTIPLDGPATSSAINNFASDIFLSIPQNISNVVRIFHYLENRFVPYKNITSMKVKVITDFKIGFKSFLAVGGLNFAIYRFTRIGLEKKEVANRYFEDVTYFLPVPVKTYRDEVMLLVQQHINYTTHVAPFVKVVLFSKGSFYAHDEIPCTVFGQFSHGAICMGDPDLESGIYGSAVLSIDSMLGMIVPKFESYAGLFMIDWSLVKKTNPVIEKMDKLMKTRFGIERMLKEQQQDISNIKRQLSKALKVDQDNEITAPWRINTIVSSDATIQDSTQLYRDVNSKLIMDFEAEIIQITDEIDSIQAEIITRRSAEQPANYEFEDLTIIGKLEVKGTSNVENLDTTTINDNNFNDLLNDCARRNQKNIVKGKKTFRNAKVENITFATINDIPAEKVAYKSGDTIRVKGDLTFKNSLRVTENVDLFEGGTVNGLILKDDLVYLNSEITYEHLEFESLKVELVSGVKYINKEEIHFSVVYENDDQDMGGTLELESLDLSLVNITTTFINGQEFSSFTNNLCFMDSDYYFPGNTTIIGTVYARGAADIKTLNDLKYPEEFLMSKQSGFTRITGHKIFTGNVSSVEVVANGLVDGIDPKIIITRSLNQTIPGNFTFSDLELTERLTVNGSIINGETNEKFILNPTLENSYVLNSNVIFNNLEVDGIVTVSKKFGNQTIQEIFENVVYKDEEQVTVNSIKQFTDSICIQHNLDIESNLINDNAINDFVTIDTEQVIDADSITGNITIDNLDLGGLFNGDHLTVLFNDVIRLDADEDVKAEIVFENTEDIPDIFASDLHVNYINGLSSEDFVWTTGDRVLEEDVQFDNVKADHAELLKDLDYEIECFDIKEYDDTRLSLTRDQNITGKYKIQYGHVDQIEAVRINDFEWDFLKNFINVEELMYEKLLSGNLEIQELHVHNSLNIETLNEYNLKELYQNVFWTNKNNNISNDVIFENDVTIKHLNIKKLNDENFEDFIADFVLKNQTDVIFDAYKTFSSGFKVESLNVDRLNDLIVDDILLKSKEQEIPGNLFFHGDVWVHDDLNLKHYINNVSIDYLKEHLKFEDNTCILKGNITFNDVVSIDRFTVKGNMNDLKPNDFFESIVSVYDDISINGTTIFKKKIRVRKNLGVAETINGVDLYDFVENVVLISSDDYIQGLVTFTQDVIVTDTIELETDLDVETVGGYDLKKWKEDAVYLTSGHIKDKLKFEKLAAPSGMKIDFLNGEDMSSLLTLHTEQVINDTLKFNFVTTDNDIEVGHLVNGYNLEEEYANTILKDTDEDIDVETVFVGPVTIAQHMKTSGLVNGKDLRRVVTTNTDQNLTASYIFQGKITVDKGMNVTGLVNDVNITDWQRRIVTVTGDEEQNITDSWTIGGNLTFATDVGGSGLLAGINIHKMAEEIANKQHEKYELEEKIRNDYKNVCSNVQDLLRIAKSQIFLFKHLEYQQKIYLDHTIEAIHHFQYEDRNFLIVSQVQNCFSKLYEWISNSFEEVAHLRTGEVVQFVTVLDSDRVYLVTKNRDSKECRMIGVNLWIFEEKSLVHIYGLDHAVLLQKSKMPGTFYSLNTEAVTEYKLFYEEEGTIVHAYRKWDVPNSNYEFNSHDHKLGLSLRNADSILKLSRHETTPGEPDYTVPPLRGEISVEPNRYLPPPQNGEVVFMEVGVPGNSFKLAAVTVREHTIVRGKKDTIIIYEDIKQGTIFDIIPAFKPSDLTVLDFGLTGETLLIFLENKKTLQIFEYKGILGFKPRSTIKIEATQIKTVSLPLSPYQSKRKFLLVSQENVLTVIQAVMDGDRPDEGFYCDI